MFYLVLEHQYIIAVSTKVIENSTKAGYSKDYLDSFGIHIDSFDENNKEQTYFPVSHPFLRFTYDRATELIATEELILENKRSQKNLKNLHISSKIAEGFDVVFGDETRTYECSIHDQLNLYHQYFLLSNEYNTLDAVPINFFVGGKKYKKDHSKADCAKVIYAMSLFILEKRFETEI